MHRVHKEGVNAAETESPKNPAGKRTAAFTGHENVSTGSTFGEREVAVFLDDELAADRHHEKHTQPSTEKRKRENSPESKFLAKSEKDERGNGEHHASGE